MRIDVQEHVNRKVDVQKKVNIRAKLFSDPDFGGILPRLFLTSKKRDFHVIGHVNIM
jgi:hypothetical protein